MSQSASTTNTAEAPWSSHDIEVVTEEELTSTYGLKRAIFDALPLLVGLAFLMAGTSFTATLLGVRAGLEGFNPTVTGLVLSAFYVGFLAGSLLTPKTIWRVGHVRVFAALASLASAAVLIHVIRPDPLTWFLLRGVSGLCLAGLYVTTETWLNGATTNSTRGSMLAIYMVVVTASEAIGQLFFPVADPRGYAAFVLASVLISLAVLPVSLATVSPPPVFDIQRMPFSRLYGTAPLAVVGAATSGFSGAAIVGGTGAVYAQELGLDRGQTSAVLFAALIGALLLQIPFGRWSDRTDRRWVMIVASVMGAVGAATATVVADDGIVVLMALTAVVGGTSFLLYSLANAHLNDYLDESKVIPAGAAMVLVYGIGAILGPAVVSAAIGGIGPEALFMFIGASYAFVALFALWRLTIRAAVPEGDRSTYAPVPVGTAPTVASFSDVSPEAHQVEPVEEGVAEGEARPVPYRMQGTGQPVVLLGRAPTEDDWDSLLAALAANGFHAVGVTLRGEHGDPYPQEDVLAVLRDLELPSATFVGLDNGSLHIADLVAENPDRTDAVIFAGPALPVAADQTELEGRSLLVLTDDGALPLWSEPGLFADVVTEFLRHLAPHPD